MDNLEETIRIIAPKTDLELQLIMNAEIREGLWWGNPRPGHPEGGVIKHVKHIFNNFLTLSEPDPLHTVNKAVIVSHSDIYFKLRLIALVHDTFKYQVDRFLSKSGENHHAMRARRFVEKNFPAFFDAAMCEVIELHDEAYNAYCKWKRDTKKPDILTNRGDAPPPSMRGAGDAGIHRAVKLIERLNESNSFDLFMLFYLCDTHIGDDDRPDLRWFMSFLPVETSTKILNYSF